MDYYTLGLKKRPFVHVTAATLKEKNGQYSFPAGYIFHHDYFTPY